MISNEVKVSEFEKFIEDRGPWDLWLTITFKQKTLPSRAKHSLKLFLKNLNSPDEIWTKRVIFCFVCFERDTRGGVHIHGLLRGIHPLYATKFEQKCKKYFGESKIEPHKPYQFPNVTLYLARKYVSKYLANYDVMKINSHLRRDYPPDSVHRIRL